jgi:hypothetical protein
MEGMMFLLRGEIMRTKRLVLVVATVTAFMTLTAPASAVTPDECRGKLNGTVEGAGKNRVCIFPSTPQECKEKFDGLPTKDETECAVKLD